MLGYAKKIGMTRIFLEGKATAVTLLQFEPNQLVQVKTLQKDGYKALQIGGGKKSLNQTTQPRLKHIEKHTGQETSFLHLSEFITHPKFELPEDKKTFETGDFAIGDTLDISADTIGRGFAGAMKRHGFAGGKASHGHDHKRAVGSIGTRWPQRVLPGKKMAGRMGGVKRTLKNSKLVAIDLDQNLLFVKGSVHGPNSAYVKIQKTNP